MQATSSGRNNQLRTATKEFEGAHVRTDPTGHLLIESGFGIGVVAGSQHSHEQLRRVRLTGGRIIDGDRVAGPVHEQLFAWPVPLAQHQVAFLLSLAPLILACLFAVAFGPHLEGPGLKIVQVWNTDPVESEELILVA